MMPHQKAVLLLCMAVFVVLAWSRAGSIDWEQGGPFKDSDDRMRMVQVLDWRAGADWYDLTQKRLDPPAGVALHWSRWPDIPLRAAVDLAEPWLGRERAIVVAAVAIPPLLGVLFCAAVVWAAQPLVTPRTLVAGGLVAVAAQIPQMMFSAGRIDHHGWQLILALIAVGAALRAAQGLARGALMMAGGAGAIGLWIGAEAIPPIVWVTVALTVLWLQGQTAAAQQIRVYGAALTAVTLALYPVAVPLARWGERTCDAFSLVSIALAASIWLWGWALGRYSTENNPRRWQLAGAVAALLVLGGALAFPECLHGPYGDLPVAARRFVAEVQEAQPLGRLLIEMPALAIYYLILPLLALILIVRRLRVEPTRLWQVLAIFVAGAVLLMFWQLRAAPLANVYANLALVWWVAQGLERAAASTRLPVRLGWRGGPALVILLLPPLVSGAVAHISGTPAGFPDSDCTLDALVTVLNGPDWQPPRLLAAPSNLGAELLLRTPHQVLAANYHRNAAGLAANDQILARPPEQARATVAERGVAAIVVCRAAPVTQPQTLTEHLQAGQLPDWLTPVPLPALAAPAREALLFRVIRPEHPSS